MITALVVLAAVTVSVTSLMWSLLVGAVLPGLTELATKEANPRLKSLFTALCAAVGGALSGFLINPPHGWPQWEQVISAIAVTWFTAIFTYLGAYKPTGLSSWIARKTSSVGFG